jgi:hypothetical protein
VISLKGEITKTIEGKNIAFYAYTWTQSKMVVPTAPQVLLDYEKSFLENLEKFSLYVNQVDDTRILVKDEKPDEGYDETKVHNNDIQQYCDMDVLTIYQSNQKYLEKLQKTIPQHIPREELENQTKKIVAYVEQFKNQIIIMIERFFKNHVQLTNLLFASLPPDPNLFGSTMASIREDIINSKIPHLCFYRKIPKYSRQILVIKDMPEKYYENHKNLINENAANYLIINLNTNGTKYNLEFVQKNKRDRKIKGFIDIPIYESFRNLQKVIEEIKRRDKEIISDSEKDIFLNQAINLETLKAYTEWKFPEKPVSDQLNIKILNDIDTAKYSKLKDIDDVIEKAKPAVDAYFKEKPDWFKYGTDFITKSLGFVDDAFLAKHQFAQETRDATKRLKRLIGS